MKRLLQAFPLLKRLLGRIGSLLMLVQRAPVIQMLFPEAKLLSTTGFSEALTLGITTVIGLGAYDTVSGASTVTQVTPTANSSTVAATAGTALSFVFKYGGSDTPDHFQVVGTLPTGLVQTKSTGSKTDSISGKPTVSGSYPITIKAWRFASQTGDNVSANFTITVNAAAAPTISSHPASTTITSGNTATLSVTASGTLLTYQWYQGTSGTTTNPISGATSASYTTPALSTTTSYWVNVTNGGTTSVSSNTAVVTVNTPPSISTHPQPVTIPSGGTATLSVTATGTSLSYQWYQGTAGNTASPISGATSANFTTPALTATTSYWVRITGTGSLTTDSSAATVTVSAPSGFASWATTQGLTSANNGNAQDPDNDGIPNLMEYVLGGNPLAAGSSILPTSTTSAGQLTFSYFRADDSKADITQTVEISTNLQNWTTFATPGASSSGAVTIVDNGSSPDRVTVTIPGSNASSGKLYARLKVTQP